MYALQMYFKLFTGLSYIINHYIVILWIMYLYEF